MPGGGIGIVGGGGRFVVPREGGGIITFAGRGMAMGGGW